MPDALFGRCPMPYLADARRVPHVTEKSYTFFNIA